MTQTHINLNISDYEWNHGHAPRGQGNWAFQVEGEQNWREYKGTFAKVRKQLDKDLKAEGLPQGVKVLTVS